ncbi:hypothetical protein RB195_006041 [Necator americanus]|uniref:Uncharacterized protein n=1 Tax=Necator americanus TaxID=51031 RepID=A0ABR1BTL3_NECAM
MDLESSTEKIMPFTRLIGDFNAKLAQKNAGGTSSGPTAYNGMTRGRLSEFIMTTKTIHGNSQFQPSSLRWTWESPGGGYRNEIDHIIVIKVLPDGCRCCTSSIRDRTIASSEEDFFYAESRESRQVRREIPNYHHWDLSLR